MNELINMGIGLTIGAIIGYLRGRSDGKREGVDAVIEEIQDSGQYWCGYRLIIIKGIVKQMFETRNKMGNPLIRPIETKDLQRTAAPAAHPFVQPVSHE